jgi:hypothetical protein
MILMIAPLSPWHMWIRVAVIAALAFPFGALVFGWWPKSTREWRWFGTVLACFTIFTVVMICVFHVWSA